MRASARAFASKEAGGMGLNLTISEDDELKPRLRGRAAKIFLKEPNIAFLLTSGQVMSSVSRRADHLRISCAIAAKVARLARGTLGFFRRLLAFMPSVRAPVRRRSRVYADTGMAAGPRGGRSSAGSVSDWTRSTVVSGAISRSKRPWGVTSMKASSVTM